MSSILRKYLLKRWLYPLLGALMFYGGMLMAYEVVGVTKEIFSIGAPFRWVGPLLLLAVPENLGMVLPMAAVLGGLMGTQHLSEGSELVAAQGLGVGMRALVKPWLLLSCGLLVLATLNAHLLVPWANATQMTAQTKMFEEARTRFLKPGAAPWFPPRSPRNAVWIAPDGQIHLMEVSNDRAQHLVAKSMQWGQSEKAMEHSEINLRMRDLRGASIHKSDGKITLIQEKEHTYTIVVPPVPKLLASTHGRFLPTRTLMAQNTPESLVELSRRFTLPLASCALLLLGIALGLGHPRFQKGGAMVKSLGVIVLYYVVLKYFENQVLSDKPQTLFARIAIFTLPLYFLVAGFALLTRRLQPHHSNRFGGLTVVRAARHWLHSAPRALRLVHAVKGVVMGLTAVFKRMVNRRWQWLPAGKSVLAIWTTDLWWRNWGSVMGTFLALSFLIEYASLAGDLVHNHVSNLVFLRYWIWNLPTFLAVVLPLAFLLGGVLSLSDATVSREWVALRAGGISFLQWCRSGTRAWGAVLALTFLLQALLAPLAFQRADPLYQQILGRPARSLKTRPSWLHLGSTGVVWFLDGPVRWGFPLKPPGQGTPIMLKWQMQSMRSEALPWDGLNLLPGPHTADLFPDKALRDSYSAEETSTSDLFHWQKWAPDPERATMIWSRLLGFLAGPCLMFAMLPYAFPTPRGGRGQSLGYSLVAGLIFMGMQALFTGAAKAGEFPPLWGILCPILLVLGFGLTHLHRLRT
ncbi:MAG: LptF/LptG family permease [Holophaga sp.]|nr:LptF/LptG family permease [Holophaga sp.]